MTWYNEVRRGKERNRFMKTMKKNKLKEAVSLPKSIQQDSFPKATSGKGRSFEELFYSIEPKVAKLLKALLGENTKVVSVGPGNNWVLNSPKYDKLVSVVVYDPGKLKIQYLSPGTANMLVIEGNRAYVRPTPLFEKRLKEEYEEWLVGQVFDSTPAELPNPKARVVAALNRLNFKARGGKITVGIMEKGPVLEFVRRALFEGETPYANRIFVGHLPGGVSVILAYRDRENLVMFHELFIESESGKVKHRILESLTKKKLEVIVQAVGIFERPENGK